MHLRTFPDHQNHVLKKDILDLLEWLKAFLMHLRILPDHQKLFFKKDIFYCLEWLKTCFDAFAHTPRPPETFVQKRYFYCLEWLKRVLMHLRILPDHQNLFFKKDVVKNVFWCICAYFQTTKNFCAKKIFFTDWSG